MKRAVFVMMIALAGLSVNCAPLCSFHPLWDKGHAVAEPKLIGTWISKDYEVLKIASAGNLEYEVIFASEDGVSHYEMRAVRLGERLYFDLFPDHQSLEKSLEAQAYLPLVPAHFFARVTLKGDTLAIEILDEEVLEKLIERGEASVPVPLKGEDAMILTAETGQIQELLLRFEDDKDFWGEPALFRRVGHPD